MRTKMRCITPRQKGETWQGERKMRDYRDKAFAFDFALLSLMHKSDWLFHGSLSKTVKNVPAANDSSMREGIPLDALN